jgi:CRP-like cAMP-binding protein
VTKIKTSEVTQAKKTELVRNSALSIELTGEQCEVLAELVTVHDLADGEILINEGESDNRLHVIVKGTLAVSTFSKTTKEWINLYVMTRGDLVGELAFMDNKPHYAALRAIGDTRVFSLERERLESLLESQPWIVYRVIRAIFRVVHGILHRMGAQQAELTNYIYKQHGKY